MSKKNLLLCFVLTIAFVSAFSQQAAPKYRIGVKANGAISEKFSYTLELQERFVEYQTVHDRFYTEANLNFQNNKYLRYSIGYRFIEKYSFDEGHENSHRFQADIRFNNGFSRWKYQLRTRMQMADPGFLKSGKYNTEYFNRNELELAYDIYKSPITPVLAYEIYYNLQPSAGRALDKLRYCIGADYRLNKQLELNVLYMFDDERNSSINYHVVEIMCTIDF